MVIKIKSPERLYKKYCKLFSYCLHKPITPKEIVENAKKKDNNARISLQSFYTQDLGRLKQLGLISKCDDSKKSIEMLKKFYGIEKKDNRVSYYFFTPESSIVVISFNKFMKKFEKYLSNKKEIILKLNELGSALMDYEFISNTNQESIEYTYAEKEKLLKMLRKVKPKNERMRQQKKDLKEKIKGRRKVNYYSFAPFKFGREVKLPKDFLEDLNNLEFLKFFLGSALKIRPFQRLVYRGVAIEKDGNFKIPTFDEAIRSLKHIDSKADELVQILNKNLQINMMDVLDNECGF